MYKCTRVRVKSCKNRFVAAKIFVQTVFRTGDQLPQFVIVEDLVEQVFFLEILQLDSEDLVRSCKI